VTWVLISVQNKPTTTCFVQTVLIKHRKYVFDTFHACKHYVCHDIFLSRSVLVMYADSLWYDIWYDVIWYDIEWWVQHLRPILKIRILPAGTNCVVKDWSWNSGQWTVSWGQWLTERAQDAVNFLVHICLFELSAVQSLIESSLRCSLQGVSSHGKSWN